MIRTLILLFCVNVAVAQIRFSDVTESAGIDHQYKVYEGLFGGGICVFDMNNDGYEDLYLTSGMNDDHLYLNNGDGSFRNVYEGSGLEVTKKFVTQGVFGADVNKDGWVDLYITTTTRRDKKLEIPHAMNLLFINNGDGSFTDATSEYKLDRYYTFSTGANFGDFNGDGFPDLYVGNYFTDYDGPLTEINDATIVSASKTAAGHLLINRGGRYFEDVYEDYGLTHRGFGFGGLFTDFDNDGDQDLIVNHDFGYKAKPNYLLRNEYPRKKFTYVEDEYDMDLRINSMASARGDYNQDGWLDYFFTNIKFNRFMTSGGSEAPFTNVAKNIGVYIFMISWGANFADFDHDGDLDLFVANGDLNPNCTPMGNFLFEQEGGRFEDKGMEAGVKDFGMGRGSVIFDIENDGDLDLLFINQEAVKDYPVPSRTKLFRNDSVSGNWLKVKLTGVDAEAHGIGSRISVIADGRKWISEVDGGGSSHISQNSTIAHFGLGSIEVVDSVLVDWTGGEQQVIENVRVKQLLEVKQEVTTTSMYWIYRGIAGVLLVGLLLLFSIVRKK